MDVDLKASIVCILKPDGTTAGTGFVVSAKGLIATCSHVVQSEESQRRGDSRPDHVDLVFHVTGDRCRAKVEYDWWRPTNAEDVAILRLEGPLPEGVKPLPLGSPGASRGHEFSSRGYRLAEHFPEGLDAEGRIQRTTRYKGQAVLQLHTNQIDFGMSGAPILDTKQQQVVGMANMFWETTRHIDAWLAFAIPSDTLKAVCPDLELLPTPSPPLPPWLRLQEHQVMVALIVVLILETSWMLLTGGWMVLMCTGPNLFFCSGPLALYGLVTGILLRNQKLIILSLLVGIVAFVPVALILIIYRLGTLPLLLEWAKYFYSW